MDQWRGVPLPDVLISRRSRPWRGAALPFHTRTSALAAATLGVIAGLISSQPVSGSGPVLTVVDVSPDAPYGDLRGREGDGDPGGKVLTIVADPQDPLIVYAASEYAGVWKSIDGAATWRQSGRGLDTGLSARESTTVLAIDVVHPQRLIYATRNDDLRNPTRSGGLYVTTDGAATWRHVSLPGCPDPNVGQVLFSDGFAIAPTRCGIATSPDLTSWTFLPNPLGSGGAPTRIAAAADNLYACQGSKIWRYSAGAWGAPLSLGSVRTCHELAAAPGSPDTAFVISLRPTPPKIKAKKIIDVWEKRRRVAVARLDFTAGTVTNLDFGDRENPTGPCCGALGVWTQRRPPGDGYDLFASDRFYFYRYLPSASPSWRLLRNLAPGGRLHPDTWSMAFPPTYSPFYGVCTMYVATDGGVFKNFAILPGTPCEVETGVLWRRTMSGLHAMDGATMAGLGHSLYFPTKDNGTWATGDGGATWTDMGCCGDNGSAFINPGLPEQVLTARNTIIALYQSATSMPPTTIPEYVDNIRPTNWFTGVGPPEQAGLSQVMTLAGTFGAADYVAVISPNNMDKPEKPTAGPDVIVRTIGSVINWEDVSPDNYFPPASVAGLATSGGHLHPTIYVLSANTLSSGPGQIFRGVVGDSGTIESPWKLLPLDFRASNLFADPYDPRYLYATDIENRTIQSSSDGGITWRVEPDLVEIATRYGEFRFECGLIDYRPHMCPLNGMAFDRDHPEIRVAVLAPGGVAFSRDAGAHWIPLEDATSLDPPGDPLKSPFAIPYSPVYEAAVDPQAGTPLLYLDLRGRGVVRVAAPFPTLAALKFEYCLTCDLPGATAVIVTAQNDTTGGSTRLHKGSDGIWRGAELLDSAVDSAVGYHFEVDGVARPGYFHVLTEEERASGVVILRRP